MFNPYFYQNSLFYNGWIPLDTVSNTVTITKYCGSSVDVTVPDTIDGRNVTSIGEAALIPAAAPGLRGIRMDVEVEEGVMEEGNISTEGKSPVLNIYDLEPHLYKDGNILKHNRFYQAKIDSRYLPSGTFQFSEMPDLYVITILNYDPFGCDYMAYHVYNRCEEVPELEYKDGLCFIYFYTDGRKGGSSEIRTLLRYMKDSRRENAANRATRKLHELVERVKTKQEVRIGYMKYEEIIAHERADEREETTREVTEKVTKEVTKEVTKKIQIQSICELLEDYGIIPPELRERLEQNTDHEVFSRWHKLAAKSESIGAFMEQM